MKKIFVIIVMLSLLNSFRCMAQLQDDDRIIDKAKLMVLYDLNYAEDSIHTDWRGNETMMLLIGNRHSFFSSYLAYTFEMVMRQKEDEGLLAEWIDNGSYNDYPIHRFVYKIYKDFARNNVTYTEYLFLTGSFQYEEDMDNMEWNILDDTLEIGGFRTQKAVCDYGGRQWEAWFAEELPFDDGPYKFHGLPGLILQISDTRGHYRFDFKSIEVVADGTKIEFGKEQTIKTTKAGFFKVEDELRDNVMDNFDLRTNSDSQKKIHAAMKSRNNPIELDRK